MLERLALVVWVEGKLVVLGAELLRVLEVRGAAMCLASVPVEADVVPEVVALEDAVVGDHPEIGRGYERLEDGGSDGRMVEGRQRVAHVMQEGTQYVLLVLTVPFGPGRRLQRMLEPINR